MRKGLSQMACGEYLHVHGVEESVRIFFGWRSMLASPALQIARSLALSSSKHSLGLMRKQLAKSKSFHLDFHVLSTHCSHYCLACNLFFGSLFGSLFGSGLL